MYGEGLAGAFMVVLLCALLIGVAVGGVLFEGLPWLYHHLSFHWN